MIFTSIPSFNGNPLLNCGIDKPSSRCSYHPRNLASCLFRIAKSTSVYYTITYLSAPLYDGAVFTGYLKRIISKYCYRPPFTKSSTPPLSQWLIFFCRKIHTLQGLRSSFLVSPIWRIIRRSTLLSICVV